MIKVKVTKNIIRKGEIMWGLTLPQILMGVAALAVGSGMFLMLKDTMDINLLMTLIFIVMALFLFCGIIRVHGVPFGVYLLKCLKGVDKRPYCMKGVYTDDIQQKK